MRFLDIGLVTIVAFVVLGVGVLTLTPVVFADRGLPGVRVARLSVTGLLAQDIYGILQQYERQLQSFEVLVQVEQDQQPRSLQDLGVFLDVTATKDRAHGRSWADVLRGQFVVDPVLRVDSSRLHDVILADFAAHVTAPVNATLALTPAGTLIVTPSSSGQGVDLATFEQDILSRVRGRTWQVPIEVVLVAAAPPVHEGEVLAAQQFANQLLRDGFSLSFEDNTYAIKPFTIRRLLKFVEVADAAKPGNTVLGVAFDRLQLLAYFDGTLRPVIDQAAVNARLALSEGPGGQRRATQFALPQVGRLLDGETSAAAVEQAIAHGMTQADLVVRTTAPDVSDVTDIEALGITTLLATGTSDFVGSPVNRRFNIDVGTARYHGVLIKPSEEFSFNGLLGPVDGAHGFKPELVIKQNVTTPEFGGGLCQVSTTVFRAAVHAGLPITERRNHSYAVRYYGTPGFDATIYPGHTDLRFTNDTPGYLLIQARVEGTNVVFELWGSPDGRTTAVAGPYPYDRQPNGAVKATLRQTVTRNGEVILDDTFYSRYKSPDLFPRAQAIDQPVAAPSV